MNFVSEVAGLVLAGGQSRRMGQDKADIAYGPNTLREHMRHVLGKSGLSPVLISHPDALQDHFPGSGPLAGIHAGCIALNGKAEQIIIVPVDMPALTPDLLGQLASAPAEASITRFKNHLLPIRLKISDEVIGDLENRLQNKRDLSLKSFQTMQSVQILDLHAKDSKHFVNLNTPEQLSAFMDASDT